MICKIQDSQSFASLNYIEGEKNIDVIKICPAFSQVFQAISENQSEPGSSQTDPGA